MAEPTSKWTKRLSHFSTPQSTLLWTPGFLGVFCINQHRKAHERAAPRKLRIQAPVAQHFRPGIKDTGRSMSFPRHTVATRTVKDALSQISG